MKLEVSREAAEYVAEHGYDAEYGARPLKRAIQRLLENPLSSALLRGEFEEGDTDPRDGMADGLPSRSPEGSAPVQCASTDAPRARAPDVLSGVAPARRSGVRAGAARSASPGAPRCGVCAGAAARGAARVDAFAGTPCSTAGPTHRPVGRTARPAQSDPLTRTPCSEEAAMPDDPDGDADIEDRRRLQGARDRRLHRRLQGRRHRALRRGASRDLAARLRLHPLVQRHAAHPLQGAHLRQAHPASCSRRLRSCILNLDKVDFIYAATSERRTRGAAPADGASGPDVGYARSTCSSPTARFVFSVEGERVDVLPEHRSPEAHDAVRRVALAQRPVVGMTTFPNTVLLRGERDHPGRPRPAPPERARAPRPRGARPGAGRRRRGRAHARPPRPRRRVRRRAAARHRARARDGGAALAGGERRAWSSAARRCSTGRRGELVPGVVAGRVTPGHTQGGVSYCVATTEGPVVLCGDIIGPRRPRFDAMSAGPDQTPPSCSRRGGASARGSRPASSPATCRRSSPERRAAPREAAAGRPVLD